jgi:hypothetical protein
MSNTSPASTTAGRLLCASGASYAIGSSTPVTQSQPYYGGAGFLSTPASIVGILPETSACLVGQTQDGIVIAFRGTVFTSVEDWITNLLVFPMPADGFPGLVHAGFYLSLAEIMDQITVELSSLLASAGADTPIFVTGHSKGGGMASLAAWYLQSQGGINASQINVITFASPMPGDGTFAAAFRDVFSQVNYINYLDMVPFLPPSAANAESIASAIPALASLMADFEKWDYTLCQSKTEYILQSGQISDGFLNYLSFLSAIKDAIEAGNIAEVLAAHSHLCGAGYMRAVCPEVACLTTPATQG